MGKYALLIGVGEYGDGLKPLPAAPHDVAALKTVLENPQMGNFDEVRTVVNPSQAMMAREIELWFQGRKPDDLIVLFFSGHGVKDERRDLYFAAQDTEKYRDRLIRSTATSARFVNDCIRSCKAKYQVIILDCCFSGAFGDMVARDDGEVDLQSQLGAEGRVVLTSTSAVDYSFEEKGESLSIYTRYLVEGIATGAADEDGDGVITVENLHRYAGRKVEEISPAMSPKIIVLKDEGYRIKLARSPHDDPYLKYRKEVELRAKEGGFSIPARRLLENLREELKISKVEAQSIEAEVIKPYQEYQRKRQEYSDTLKECLQEETPLSEQTIQDLIALRSHLQLTPNDVASTERRYLNELSLAEYALQAQSQKISLEYDDHQDSKRINKSLGDDKSTNAQKVIEHSSSISPPSPKDLNQLSQIKNSGELALTEISEPIIKKYPILQEDIQKYDVLPEDLTSEIFFGDVYKNLRDYLAEGDWLKADQETERRILELVNCQNSTMKLEDIKRIPGKDLHNIDTLWVKYSQGRFGFSIQKQLWQNFREPIKYGNAWNNFGKELGWKKEKDLLSRGLDWFRKNVSPLESYDWIDIDGLRFDLLAPAGHLPVGPFKIGSIVHYSFLANLSLDFENLSKTEIRYEP